MGGEDFKSTQESPTPIENEVKILGIPMEKVGKRLHEAGIEPHFVGEVENIRFDTEDRLLKENDTAVRVRRITTEDGETTYRWTIKTKVPPEEGHIGKRCRELESTSLDLQFTNEQDALLSLKEHLIARGHMSKNANLVEKRRVVKGRVTYKFPEGHEFHGAVIDIDKLRSINGSSVYNGKRVATVPAFLEIEGESTAQQKAVAKFLGIQIYPEDAQLTEGDVIRRYFS